MANFNKPRHGLSKELVTELCNLYISGKPIEQLSQIYKISYAQTYLILQSNKIKMRSNREDYAKFIYNVNYFSQINTEDKAYFLGLLFADGNISKKRNSVTISLKLSDSHI